MAWAFSVSSGIAILNQSGTETSMTGIATAITNQATVARSTAYVVGALVKPPAANGMWYRCSTAGTTAATAPTYNPLEATTTTDGTAVFTSVLAPIVRTLGTQSHYYMPAFRFAINGTFTNANPQIQNFTCWDLIQYGAASIFTSGSWASDGVTPLYDGVHFTATRVSANNSDSVSGGFQLQNAAQCTLIGGEVQVAGAIGFAAGTTPRTYYTRWRGTKQWGGVSSTRFRSYSANAILRGCEFYDMAFDLFQMPAEFSVKARKSEYVAQYVGSLAGGVDAYFKASALENVDGSYDFDNYGNGYVELFNCAKGANLKVVTQLNATMCTPLYQDLEITAKDTAGLAVQNVRFSCTDIPNNSPTQTFTTRGNLKTWDFRNPLTYQTTTNASGIATSSPVLQVWYYSAGLKKNLRFPLSTAVYEGRAYGFKPTTVSVVLGSNSVQQLSAGMIAIDTATTVTETVAGTITKFTFVPSGATGGTVTATANFTFVELWNYYQWWISQFANRSSNDTWTAIAGRLNMAGWSLSLNAGVIASSDSSFSSIYATTLTLGSGAVVQGIYETTAGTNYIAELTVSANSSIYIGNSSTGITKLFQSGVSAGTYRAYYEPGTAPVVLVARELYTKQRFSEIVTLSPGLNTFTPIDVEDVGITETDLATVLAYTAIEGPSKFYDRTAAFRLTEQGIKLGQMVTRSGKALETGSFSHVINKDAASVYSVTSNVITTKAIEYAGDNKYDTEILTPPATLTANTTEVITIQIEDANGDSQVSINGGDGTFELWKVPTTTATNDYATGTLLATVGNGIYRFIGVTGFDIVGVDVNSNIRRRSSMAKGIYTQAFYVGDQIQLAQAPQVIENGIKLDVLTVNIEDIKGTGFTKDKHSLTKIWRIAKFAASVASWFKR